MIQLTKGTNVLDINLSDFSGAGQDVVQNGSFDDIGSDLVQNGDFAQIGSELVTNGDFSAASSNLITNPNFSATGSELVVNGDFLSATSWNVNSNWNINTVLGVAEADGTSDADINQSVWLPDIGKSYKVTFEVVSRSQGEVLFKLGGVSGQAHTTTGIKTEYIVATSTDRLKIDSQSSFIGSVKDVSVKELGEDWTSYELGTSTVTFGENVAEINIDALNSNVGIYQENIFSVGKNYKIVLSMKATASFDAEILEANNASLESTIGTASLTTSYQDFTYYFTATGTFDLFIHRLFSASGASQTIYVQSVVVQELGEGWSVGTGWSIEEDKASVDASVTTPLSQSPVSITNGKSYKISLEITDYQSGFLKPQFGGQIIGDFNSNGVKTFYATADATSFTTFYLYALGTSDFSVSNVTVKEVGQDWTIQEPDGQSVTFPNSTLSIIYDSTETQGSTGVYQDILTIGKYYKIEIDVASITGDLKLQVGSESQVINTTGTSYFYTKSDSARIYIVRAQNGDSVSGVVNSISIKQLDTNNRWVTFADPDSKSVMKLGQVDLEIDSSGNNCGVYQTGLIKPNKLYIITINMKATADIYVEIAASLGTAVSAVIGTETLTTSYVEYSYEYVTPFAVDHDLQIHRLFGSGADQTISIDYVSMNGVDESQWTNDPTWDPFATSLVFVPTLTDESTNNSKQFTLNTSITDGGWDGRSLHGQVIINEFPTEIPAAGVINLKQPDFLEGFYQVEIRGYLGTFYRVLGKCMAHLERASTEDGYNRFESYNDTVTYKAYEE